MADICTCGHDMDDWREHVYDAGTDRYACMHPRPGASGWRTRSPLSAFRGPMRWTREDAAAALDLLGFTHSADAARFGDLRRRRASMHELLDCARYDLACGSACRHESAALGLLAARILRAVRP